MKLQYKIDTIGNKSYPMVRFKRMLYWSKWKRIGVHVDNFGLYDEYNHSKTKEECKHIITEFDKWLNTDISHEYFDPNKQMENI